MRFLAVTAFFGLFLCPFLPSVHSADGQAGTGFRALELAVPADGTPGFTLMDPAAMGIDFSNALSDDRIRLFQNLMNGSGLAAADVDGDGRVDLYFCHKQAPNQLYLNLGGGRFTNVTVSAGVGCTNQSSVGAVFADVNGDGAPDLLVSAFGGPNALLLNDGHGHFQDVTASSGIVGKSGATSMALGDIDGDGDLDLYICNFAVQAVLRDGGTVSTRMVNGQAQVTGRFANRIRIIDGILYEFGDPDSLLLNDGRGHFTAVPWEQAFSDAAGKPMSAPWDLGLAVQMRDVNGDGFQDLFVCNDFQTPDRMWLGDGRGHFREAGPFALRNMSLASMGVDFADLDRDGRYDFCTVEMLNGDLTQNLRTTSGRTPLRRTPGVLDDREEFPRNCLYWNRGDDTWAEIASYAGVAATGWSWTPLFLDVDLDGWEDLLVSNGHGHDVNDRDINERTRSRPGQNLQATRSLLLEYPPLRPPKFAFRNRHDLTFSNTSEAWGFTSLRIAHGMIAVDYDGDGDLDVMANALDGPPLIWRNNATAPRVAVRLKGSGPNTAGIGGEIILRGGPVEQRQMIIAGGQYLSHSQTQRTFAAGPGEMSIEVRWPSGKVSHVPGVRPNHLYDVDEAGAVAGSIRTPGGIAGGIWFTNVSPVLGHTHAEPVFDDFAVQPLLPQRYSQLGPGVAWCDLNGDGHDDLLVGTGRGGKPGVFLGNGHGAFTAAAVSGPVSADDLGAVIGWRGVGGRGEVLASQAGFESGGNGPAPMALRWNWIEGGLSPTQPLPGGAASAGPLAVGDVDGDGDLDVFVGARLIPRRWPAPGGSRFFRNDGGNLVPESPDFWNVVGPVSDALLVDLEGDARPELVLACELGPIRVFSRKGPGEWTERTREFGLEKLTGWWNSVAAGDVDGDGRLDLIAGNRGRNSMAEIWGGGQVGMLYGDFDDSGIFGVVETATKDGVMRPLRDRKTLASALPDLVSRFPTHAAFANADARSVVGRTAARATGISVGTLDSVVALNRGGRFEIRSLPMEAQWSPVFGVAAADFDGDGHLDLALAQNLFAVRPEDTRLDAGRGMVLRGDGAGGFVPVPGDQSGLAIYGEQRGAAASDFDEDGRVDLVIAQNGAAIQLLRNLRAQPGLRVRIGGAAGNLDSIGAVYRPVRGGQRGAAQTVTAGGGYWSQPSAVGVIGGERPEAVEVVWPDGQTLRMPVPAGAAELRVPHPSAPAQ